VEKDRLETFADGVFAIAATLLIIDVGVQARGHALGGAVLHAWPQYAAYAVSFMTIGIMWLNHRDCMRQIASVDRTFMVINLVLLLCIAFVPFPTRLVAEHFHDGGLRAAALTYGITLTTTAVCFVGFWLYAVSGKRLLAADADPRVIAGISRSYVPGATIYGVATLVSLWSPKASVALFTAITLVFLFDSSVFAPAEATRA
jgi:uncharacterized membrane protein